MFVFAPSFIPAAFFDQIFPWSFWSIDQLDRVLHICLEFCHVVPVVLHCVVLRLAVCCVVTLRCVALCSDLLFVVSPGCVALHCIVLQSAVCCVHRSCCVALHCAVVMHCICFVLMSYLVLFCCVVLSLLCCVFFLVFCLLSS